MTRRAAIGAAGLGLAGSLAACGGDDGGETGGGGPAGGASTDAPTATGGGTPGSSGSGPSSGPSAQAGAGPELPTYHQQRVSTPTSPAVDYDGYGAEALFDGYPDQPKSFFNGAVPGEGGPLTAMSIINLTIKYGSSNAFWTELLKRLGVDLKPQGGPSSGYVAKFNTAIAGGQIADAMQIIPGTVSRLPDVLKADFQDLTEFVSGDAIKDYPALANIPTASWKSTVFNNGIYAIPLHRSSLMWAGTARMDLLKAKGLPTAPTSGEELLQMFRGLTDHKQSHYALAFPYWVLAYVAQTTGAPNEWSESGGKFTRDYETDEYKRALGLVASMWSEGLFHPDSFASSDSQGSRWYHNGVVNALVLQGAWAWHQRATKKVIPDADVNWYPTPMWDGGGPANSYVGPGIYSITALKKGSPDRIREVLRVLDWLAVPYGTEESLFLSLGVEGVDYTVEDGVRTTTDRGKAERWSTWYISYRPQINTVKDQYDSEVALLKHGRENPTVGLYSDAAQTKGAPLDKHLTSVQGDIIQGRKKLSAWGDAVRYWRNGGGEKIRSEYQEAFQKAQ